MKFERFKKGLMSFVMPGALALPIVALLLFTLGLAPQAWAQRYGRYDRMVYLGQANVDGRTDHDEIKIGRNEGRFRRLQIRVDRGPIEFNRVVVHYANGQDEVIEFRDRIPAGGRTRFIDLRGGDRAIRSVEFWYERGNWRARREPRVLLYGG